MRILNQDRNRIINLDNITEIVANGKEVVITSNIDKSYGEIIAEYETETRAQEILLDIFSKSDKDERTYKIPRK